VGVNANGAITVKRKVMWGLLYLIFWHNVFWLIDVWLIVEAAQNIGKNVLQVLQVAKKPRDYNADRAQVCPGFLPSVGGRRVRSYLPAGADKRPH